MSFNVLLITCDDTTDVQRRLFLLPCKNMYSFNKTNLLTRYKTETYIKIDTK